MSKDSNLVPPIIWKLLDDRVPGLGPSIPPTNIDTALEYLDSELQAVNLQIEGISEPLSVFTGDPVQVHYSSEFPGKDSLLAGVDEAASVFTGDPFASPDPDLTTIVSSIRADTFIDFTSVNKLFLNFFLLETFREIYLAELTERKEFLLSVSLLLRRLLVLWQRTGVTLAKSDAPSVSVRFFHHLRAPPGPTTNLFWVGSNNMTVLSWEQADGEHKKTNTNSNFKGRCRQDRCSHLPGGRSASREAGACGDRSWVSVQMDKRVA